MNLFILGAIIYTICSYIPYINSFKSLSFLTYLMLAMGIIANLSWLTVAKQAKSPTQLMLLGLYWDSMLTAIYLIVPFLFFNIQLTMTQFGGLVLMVAGIIITKI